MPDAGLAGQLVHQFGYWGLALSLILNCMGVPIASEIILPLAGVLVRTNGFDLVAVLATAVLAQMAGFTVAYFIARSGGTELLEKYGRYLFINHRQIARLHRLFQRHGAGLILLESCIPGLHGYIGFSAGLAEMNFYVFEVVGGIGTMIWTAAMVGLGLLLYRQISSLVATAHSLGILGAVVAGLALAVYIWYIWRQSKRRRRK